jgi:lipopolysaccharide export system protein LptA
MTKGGYISFFLFLLILAPCSLCRAQIDQKTDVIHLLKAEVRAEHYVENGITYRRVIGPAKFLHNNTYILCDTALWNTQNRTLDATGNVRVLQDQTQLTGETLHYIQDLNLAQVRGKVVELFDNKNNHLRTQNLDFNTKDSIGTFFGGGSMMDSDGNVLESLYGRYFSKEKLFTFEQRVAMYADTVTIKADSAFYRTDTNIATFRGNINAWHTDGYLRSSRGQYERDLDYFHFNRNVYLKTDDNEVWADTLNFDRQKGTGTLYGNIQILDTTQHVILLGDVCHFWNDPQKIRLTKNPVFIAYKLEEDATDSLFARADTLLYQVLPKYQVDSSEVVRAEARLRYLKPAKPVDSLPQPVPQSVDSLPQPVPQPVDSLPPTISPPIDSLPPTVPPPLDSLPPPIPQPLDSLPPPVPQLVDSLPPPPPLDTTSIRLLYAWHNVKAFRNNAQGIADSLIFHTIDSTARLYGKPVLWNDNNQFSADSIQFFFYQDKIHRADLFSTAFVVSQEDVRLFNQIKGKDMIAYFRDNDIYRFDAIGSAEAIFCIREDSLVSSINRKSSKELSISLKERQVQRITYKESIKSNLYPLLDLSIKDRELPNFRWMDSLRPKDRYAITSRAIRPSIADQSQTVQPPSFPYTQQFFPGHIKPIELKPKKSDTPPLLTDTLPTVSTIIPNIDSIKINLLSGLFRNLNRDSLQRSETPPPDTILPLHPPIIVDAPPPPSDTLVPPIQIIGDPTDPKVQEVTPYTPTKKELRVQRRAERRELRAQRKAERREKAALRRAERKAKATQRR